MVSSSTEIPGYFTKRIREAKERQLTELDLSVGYWDIIDNDDKLNRILEEVFELTQLERLNLSGNSISEIPDTISKLTDLTELYLSRNRISEIPDIISKLTNLTWLNLDENRISEIPGTISKLTNLAWLNLDGNNISEIPDIISKLTNLTGLNLNRNRISEIPRTISKLTNLTGLYLGNNRISEIPGTISKLTDLTWLNLSGNEIEIPPLEIVIRGINSIRHYFLQLEAGGDYIYEAKLIIVGEAGAGKTTLAKKIGNPDYKLQKDELSTKGIDVITWKFNVPGNNREFQVNIWDFGGQEIYHTTHQFFLTKRSLYALVADTRKEDTNFYYWLNVVELLTDNSPLLIIKNEKQDRQREINVNALRGRFSNLREILATNLKTNRGLPEVITNIQDYIKKLPHIGQVLPKTWVRVREALEKDTRNYISLEEYLDICEVNGFTKLSDKLQLSGYLHDLGVCLHFQDREDSILYKTVILKPKWGTDAVYKVLDNKQVINNQGCFTRNDLKEIWHEDKYVSMRGELLELMRKFQLCYKIPSCEGTFISPQLLSENQPEYGWDESDNLILRYSYPDFMPKGIISRFIVVMHQYIYQQDYVWKSGVILNQDNARAEVIENYGKREIRIRVAGKSKRNFMTIVTHELDRINNSYKRLKYQKLIPCNCSACKNSQNPYAYEFNELVERVTNNKLVIECRKPPYYEVQVLGLIDNAINIKQLISKSEQDGNKSFHVEGDIKQLVFQLSEQGDISGGFKMGDRKIKIDNSQVDKSDQSKNFEVGNVRGDFKPTNSPITSDDAQINMSSGLKAEQKQINWGLIVSIAAIIISVCVGGLFNKEIREFLNLKSPFETPEKIENVPAN